MRLRALGQAIRVSRTKLGLTQSELAELADLHPTYISSIEAGTANISFETIDKLAHALKLKTSWLFDRADQ